MRDVLSLMAGFPGDSDQVDAKAFVDQKPHPLSDPPLAPDPVSVAIVNWHRTRIPPDLASIPLIRHALAPLGVRDITMPTTPFKVWQAIRDSR
jgi:hypothetical protein